MFLVVDGHTTIHYLNNKNLNYKQVICNENITDYEILLLRKMHKLRYKVFFEKLKWSKGLEIHNGMEFDEFDTVHAKYLIHVNSKNDVDACTRLLPTDRPYLLGKCYSDFVTTEPLPSDRHIFETTRFVVDNENTDTPQLLQKTIAAMIKWGVNNNVKNFVSLTTAGTFVRALKRLGWDPTELGQPKQTQDDIAVALKYSSNISILNSVCTRSNIPEPYVFDAKIHEYTKEPAAA